MKSTIQFFFFILFSISLLACVMVQLTPSGGRVRVTRNPEVVKNCKYLNYVQGADHFNGGLAGQGAAEENAMRRIRNNTAMIGANTVYITSITTGTSGSSIRGEAYFCK